MSATVFDQLVEALAERVAARLAELQPAQAASCDPSPWMNVESAAGYLDLPKQRLYKLTAEGAIPHYKQDARLLFHRGELDDWLTQFRQPADWISSGNRAISP
jgi:excisionase family DNA binding protein